jgi:hypothetical protein
MRVDEVNNIKEQYIMLIDKKDRLCSTNSLEEAKALLPIA